MKKTFKTLVFAIVGLLALASCEDVPAPYSVPDKNSNTGGKAGGTVEPQGEGTVASPFNVAAIVAKIKEMPAGVESTEEYYIKGKVSNVKTDAATITKYGNHTFEMIDEGDNSTVFTAFQVYGPGKQKFTSVDDIKVGDEVVVCGRVVNFKGNTPETVGKGAAYVVSINSSGGGGGSSEEGIAVTCAQALEIINGLSDGGTTAETYSVTGYIVDAFEISGKPCFWMSDTKDGEKIIEAYNASLPQGVTAFSVGMKVTITGKLKKYVNKSNVMTPEVENPIVKILEAGGGSGTSDSSKDKPLSITQAKTANGNNYVKGYIVGYVDGQKLADGAIFGVPASAETEILLAETPDETSTDNVFPVQLPAGDIRNALELSAHPDYLKKEVLLYGSVETYFGVPGLKATSWGSINGNTFGKDPESGGTDIPSGEAKGSGTESDPYNAIAAITYAQSLGSDVESTKDIYVTGIISSIKYTYSSSYGTATYNISVDGKAENEFTVYGSYYLNNQPWKDGDTQIEKGDVVVVCGKVVNYKGNTPEFVNKKNWLVSISKSSGGGDTPEPPTPGPGGDTVTDLVNGDFESWVSDTEPTGWKSASAASNAELGKSTESHGGSFACIVKAPGTQNKRLATQEITLAAGSYTFSFYAKSTTGDVCQTRPGHVTIKADVTTDTFYYPKDENGNVFFNLTNNEWTLVSYDFELAAETKLCLIVMNPKNSQYSVSQDILIDDATLVKK